MIQIMTNIVIAALLAMVDTNPGIVMLGQLVMTGLKTNQKG